MVFFLSHQNKYSLEWDTSSINWNLLENFQHITFNQSSQPPFPWLMFPYEKEVHLAMDHISHHPNEFQILMK